MARFKVVSVDMFQTLVDVNSGHYRFWQEVLGEGYSEDRAEEYTASWAVVFSRYVNNVYERENGFVSLKKICEDCFDEVFQDLDISFDPVRAAQIQIDLHKTAPAYEDTECFLEAAGQSYPVCLVSDADEEMIQAQLERFQFDQVFISERLKSYKNDPTSRLFQAVLDQYQTRPETIIHIGDSYSDVFGANLAGLTSCWLNRNGTVWKYDIKPDFVVSSLAEAVDLIR